MINKIKDISTYNQAMNKSIIDKLYWIKHIYEPIEQIVDFGCGPGSLLRVASVIFPDCELIGYDKNPEMINIATGLQANDRIVFTDDFDNIDVKEKSVLVLSSVLHEIYSYCSAEEIKEFWNKVLMKDFQYIVIRDMIFVPNKDLDVVNINGALEAIKRTKHADKLKDFEAKCGQIKELKQLNHFLLKYNYETNWDREVNENYFACDLKEVKDKLSPTYSLKYLNSFFLPWCAEVIKKDFDITALGNTHIKAIYKRKT